MPELVEPSPPPQLLMATALDYFRAEGWPTPRKIDREIIELDFERSDIAWVCFFEAREAERQVIFYSTYKRQVPEERIPAMCELVARANAGLAIGNFELDVDDGELRFKTSVDVNNTLLTDGLLSGLTSLNIAAMNVYAPGIDAVIDGESPAAAIASIEEG